MKSFIVQLELYAVCQLYQVRVGGGQGTSFEGKGGNSEETYLKNIVSRSACI